MWILSRISEVHTEITGDTEIMERRGIEMGTISHPLHFNPVGFVLSVGPV